MARVRMMNHDRRQRSSGQDATQTALVVFTPSGRRGRFALGTPLLQAARSARRRHRFASAAAAASAGAARSRSARAVRQARHRSRAPTTSPGFGAVELRYAEKRGPEAGPAAVLPDPAPGRPRHRRAARQPGAQAGRAQARRDARSSRSIRRSGSTMSRSREPDMHDPSGDLRRLEEALAEQWGMHRPRLRPAGDAAAAEGAARQGDWTVTVAVAPRRARDRSAVWPGFRDKVYGLAFDIGSTTIAGHLCDLATGEVVASAGADEPADPLRRGSDEPGLLRHDEPRRRRGADRGGARGAQRPGRPRSPGEAGIASSDILEVTLRRQPDHASPAARASTRSSSAARPSRWPPTGRSRSGRPRSTSRSTPTPGSTCCPASPAMSAPTPPA